MRDVEPAKMKRVPFTGIRRVLEKANALEAQGRRIVHFEVGQPDFDTPDNIKEAAKTALDQGVTAYSSNYGDIKLRRAIARKLEAMNGLKVDPAKEVMVTCGGEEAVAAALFALLEAGDEVLIADPSYIPYSSLTKIAQAEPVYVPLDEKNGYCFDLDAAEKAVTDKTRLLILCTPGNPTATLREALEAEGIPYSNDKDPILSRRYAVVTHYPFKGGCEICVLQSNCPKGQGQMEATSVVLPGYEHPQQM